MFFRATDIQLSSCFKINLSEGQRIHIKSVLDSSLYSLLIKPNLGRKILYILIWNCVRTC